VWAPAWVVWRHSPGWVGWAPLPPQVVVRPGIEIRAANIDVHINPSWFCFVEERRILAPHVRTYIAPPARNVSLIQVTQNVTHYTVIQNRVVNRGIPVERIERVMARPVPRMRIVEAQAPEVMQRVKVREREREVVLFRPITPPVVGQPGARAQAPQNTPPPRVAPSAALPQQQEDTYHRLRERQIRERAALEERQRQAPQSGLQSLSPEQLRVQRGAERRTLEEKARRDRQEREQQQTQQQLQQQQALERQRVLQQKQPQVLQQQALERQRALLQQQHNHQPPLPQGVPPQASQQQRAAPQQRAPEEGRKKQPQPPQAQQPAQQ
jgi:hypothetical protein